MQSYEVAAYGLGVEVGEGQLEKRRTGVVTAIYCSSAL